MDFFVARQPIFDKERRVFGYEILFRSSARNVFDGTAASKASSNVILQSFFSSLKVEDILEGKRGFFNFDRQLLLEQAAVLLPKDRVVIEILETVKPDSEVITNCGILKDRGYMLALDDFRYTKEYDPLIELAAIIKVDVQATPIEEQQEQMAKYRARGIRMLAEKIETPEAFDQALAMGYTFFQGYFFARPMMMQGRQQRELKPNYMRILREVNRPEMNLGALETALRQDVALSYRLMKYLSSPLFGFRKKVESLREAIVLMGEDNLRKWFALATLSGLADDKPHELTVSALVRAFFCEKMSKLVGKSDRSGDFFLMGLFSRLDAFLDCPLEEAIAEIGLPADVRAALLGTDPDALLSRVARTVFQYEAGDWEGLFSTIESLPPAVQDLGGIYYKVLKSCRDVFQST